MKKITAVLMSLLLVSGLVACGNDDAKKDSTPKVSQQASDQTKSQKEGETSSENKTESTGKKTLVVYYSASGNTKEVAEYIASATGGDLFEIVPKEVYTDEDLDWTNEDSRVSFEHENEAERVVELESETAPDWESYDTVFIGYPIWWGIAAWPVDGFIKANDFTGKTVIPFCTSASSGLGESGELLEEMAGTGNWQEGERFRSGASENDVRDWVEGLGL